MTVERQDAMIMEYSWQEEFGTLFAGKKVLVTGATGFIGGHLCEALHVLDARLYALALEPAAPSYIRAERYASVDLTDFRAVHETVSEIRPDLIFHLAGLVTASRDRKLVLPMVQNNFLATVNLLQAASEMDCQRVVVTGTAEEPGVEGGDSIPTSPYAASKAASTMYARMFYHLYSLPVVIVRPFLAYGPRQNPSKLIPYTILSLLRGKSPQISNGERICDFIYVWDLVRGFLKAGLQHGIEGISLELGAGDGVKIRALMDILTDLIPGFAKVFFADSPERLNEQSLIADFDKTSKLLHWNVIWTLRDGLHETVEWYREQDLLSNPGRPL